MNDNAAFELAIKFTETYKQYSGAHRAIREAMCLKHLYPAVLDGIRAGDLFAGRLPPNFGGSIPVDFNTQKNGDGGFAMNWHALEDLKKRLDPERCAQIDAVMEFWDTESTFVKIGGHVRETDPELHAAYLAWRARDDRGYQLAECKLPRGAGFVALGSNTRVAGLMLHFDKLLRLGLPGLAAEVEARLGRNDGDRDFLQGLSLCLENFADVCRHFENEAEEMTASVKDARQKADMTELASTLRHIQTKPPETLRQAIQLMWLQCQMSRVMNYGRMDVYLGDFLAADLAAGRLDMAEAKRLLLGLWKLIDESRQPWDTRIVIGGVGRRNEVNADRFALLAMESTRQFKRPMPTLTLRFHKDQNPALMAKALDVIRDSGLYPTLYNDDVYVDGARRILDVPLADAQDYLPLGCGELILDHASVGSPNSVLNVPKALEAALHNGRDAVDGRLLGPETGALDTLGSYDKLLDAFKTQLHASLALDTRWHTAQHEVLNQECAFLYQSLVFDDCIDRGKALLDGGARYLGGCNEGFGFTNAADSLLAIKKLVFEQKRLTLEQLVAVLDADFAGHERERNWMLEVPKFGNADPEADALHNEVCEFIHATAKECAKPAGLDYYIVSSVNPGGITLGRRCGASADGRKLGEPFAVGDSPTAGFDKSGITSLLSSVAKSDAANGGYITNLKLSKDIFVQHRPKLEAALKTFFASGGQQLNITVVSRGDLEDAIKSPEKYPHVLVRIGGFSARFIDLDPVTQREVLARTMY